MKKLYWLQHNEFGGMGAACFEMVVQAESEGEARDIAADNSKEEGEEVWRDYGRASCTELPVAGPSAMIVRHWLD